MTLDGRQEAELTSGGDIMKTKLLLLTVAVLTGCATSGDYTTYLQAQQEAHKLALQEQKPLVKLTAQPGQQITGLHSLEVYTPTAAPVIQQAKTNEWAAVVGQGLGVIGTLGGIYYGGQAAIGIASEIRQGSTHGYQYIQNPLTQPAPVIVKPTDPIIVKPADPVIVKPADPIIIKAPDPIIVRPEVIQPLPVTP